MLIEKDLSYQIRACVFEVYRQLGHGFLEKVYEKALIKELVLRGLCVDSQKSLPVYYKGELIGEYVPDLVVEQRVILELKAQEILPKACEAQLMNYLKASGLRVGMLVNFSAPMATVKRFVL